MASEQPVEDYFTLSNLDEDDGRTWVELVPKTEDTEMAKLRIAFMDGQLDYAMFGFNRPAESNFLQVA